MYTWALETPSNLKLIFKKTYTALRLQSYKTSPWIGVWFIVMHLMSGLHYLAWNLVSLAGPIPMGTTVPQSLQRNYVAWLSGGSDQCKDYNAKNGNKDLKHPFLPWKILISEMEEEPEGLLGMQKHRCLKPWTLVAVNFSRRELSISEHYLRIALKKTLQSLN